MKQPGREGTLKEFFDSESKSMEYQEEELGVNCYEPKWGEMRGNVPFPLLLSQKVKSRCYLVGSLNKPD